MCVCVCVWERGGEREYTYIYIYIYERELTVRRYFGLGRTINSCPKFVVRGGTRQFVFSFLFPSFVQSIAGYNLMTMTVT